MKCGDWSEENWEALIFAIQQKECILLLGPEAAVDESLDPPGLLTAILANELSDGIGHSIEAWNINPSDLVQISQFYSVKLKRNILLPKVKEFYKKRLQMTSDLHRDLAVFPFPLVITTSLDGMLYTALRETGKEPIIESYNYKGNQRDIEETGTVDSPLLYYLYGAIDEPQSLVLSENDLLDFLVAVVSKAPPLPRNILSELIDPGKSLLFLGFGFKNWYLRILLHVLNVKHKDTPSFALEQFIPGADEFQRTIMFYKESDYRIDICNSELKTFVKELRKRYEEKENIQEPLRKPLLHDAPTAFICHASEDKARAISLYNTLEMAGIRPWLDRENLRGGDAWDEVIEKTIKKDIDYFIILQSTSLANKREGYVNKEIHFALKRRPEFRGLKFIIPVKYGECPLLDNLDELQTIDLSLEENVAELNRTIKRDYQLRKR